MKTKKRDKVDRAFLQGFKAGVRGHDMESCPFVDAFDARGSWFAGWRDGRSSFIAGYLTLPDRQMQMRSQI